MEHTWESLSKMTVAKLREIAAGLEHDAVKGYTQLNKDHLLPALCEALGIEAHAHHEVVGVNKRAIKLKIRELKERRASALEARDSAQLKRVRRQIHGLKRKLHKATV